MKALTVKQPYAQLIAEGKKDIENRAWPTIRRGRVFIHAGQSKEYFSKDCSSYLTQAQFDLCTKKQQWMLTQGIWVMSAIIGEVDIVDCVQGHTSPWALPDHWHWVLANAELYDQPVLNVKGSLSFWEYPKQ